MNNFKRFRGRPKRTHLQKEVYDSVSKRYRKILQRTFGALGVMNIFNRVQFPIDRNIWTARTTVADVVRYRPPITSEQFDGAWSKI